MSYRDEFPDFGDVDVTIPDGFQDLSWHNDTCPSFGMELPGYPESDPRWIRVFIDYADKTKSEHPDNPRFLAVVDGELGSEPATQLASDAWKAVVGWLKAEIARYPLQ